MPSIRILSVALDEKVKEQIAADVCIGVKSLLKVPKVAVFFQEYDSFYVNGEKCEKKTEVTLLMEGPEINRILMNDLCGMLNQSVKNAFANSKCTVSFVYHSNDHNHVGADGMLLSMRSKKKV